VALGAIPDGEGQACPPVDVAFDADGVEVRDGAEDPGDADDWTDGVGDPCGGDSLPPPQAKPMVTKTSRAKGSITR